MRKPTEIERLYLDFDGFFASVEQQARPRLRGRPVGVVPFEGAGNRGILIACSREAKEAGVKNIMDVRTAREKCPDLLLVSQSPDLYRRAHNALLSEIMAVLPIDAVPDFLLGFGFTDDMAVLLTAFNVVRTHVTPDHRRRAREAIARIRAGAPISA